jgi:hypothetical protein
VFSTFAHEAAGALRIRHSLRPPYLEGVSIRQNPGAFAPRDHGSLRLREVEEAQHVKEREVFSRLVLFSKTGINHARCT